MSDFDKEAEREKLREKYAKDERKRKQTQRMSELLLKGATMTNRHCDRCGDPIFRYDGQEFCPTCASQDADGAEAVPDRDTEIETPEMSLDSAQDAAAAAEQQSADGAAASQATDGNVEDVAADAPKQPAPTPQSRPSGRRTPPSQQSTPATTDDGATASQSAGTGRAALQQALSNAAHNAAVAEDPHTAKAWLEAAREAAEALSALDR